MVTLPHTPGLPGVRNGRTLTSPSNCPAPIPGQAERPVGGDKAGRAGLSTTPPRQSRHSEQGWRSSGPGPGPLSSRTSPPTPSPAKSHPLRPSLPPFQGAVPAHCRGCSAHASPASGHRSIGLSPFSSCWTWLLRSRLPAGHAPSSRHPHLACHLVSCWSLQCQASSELCPKPL